MNKLVFSQFTNTLAKIHTLELPILEHIRIIQVRLSYHGFIIPLPLCFRYEHNCTLTKFGMHENFIFYLKNKSVSSKWTPKPNECPKCSKCELKPVATESGGRAWGLSIAIISWRYTKCCIAWFYFSNI